MGNIVSPEITAQIEAEMAQTPQGRAQLEILRKKRELSAIQQQMIHNEVANQEPFAKTPEQVKFLDYLSAQNYGGNAQREEYDKVLQNRMMGGSGSLAQAQLAQNMNQNSAATAGAMGTSRGIMNPALMANQVTDLYSQANQQAINSASTDRAKESLANAGMYSKDLAAGSAQQLAEQKQYADNLALDRQSNIDRQRFLTGIQSENQRSIDEANARSQARNTQIMAGLGQGATSLLSASMKGTGADTKKIPDTGSDIRIKKDIKGGEQSMNEYLDSLASRSPADTLETYTDPMTGELRQRRLDDPISFGSGQKGKADPTQFLDSLTPYEYKYKDPNKKSTGPGQRLGIMAQDLEKTPQGKSMVKNTKDGKKINADVSTLLGAEALNHQRIKSLENELIKTKEQVAGAIPSINMPSSSAIPSVNMPTYPSDKLVRSYSENGKERLRVPGKEWPTYGLSPNTGDIVRRGDSYVSGAVNPTPEDIKKVANYLDMVKNMETSKVPMPEKYKRTRTK